MRILILGGTGMLGQAVVAHARRQGATALALSSLQGDISDPQSLAHWVDAFRPGVIVNCAAFTQVDNCESQSERALAINGEAVANVARAAAAADAHLVHVSTDYVFDGRASTPYREGDSTEPPSVYGQSKLLGEQKALEYERSLVVRVSWLFGSGGGNFVTTLLRLMKEGRNPLRVEDDQVGAPTYTRYLARALFDLASEGVTGIFHYRNREAVSWYGFSREIIRQWNPRIEVEPVTTEAFPRPAPRPPNSVLDIEKFERVMRRPVEPWSAGLAEYLAELRRGTHS